MHVPVLAMTAGETAVEQQLGAAVARPVRRGNAWFSGLGALLAVYFFIAAIDLMGHGLKTAAQEPATQARMHEVFVFLTGNALAALCVGVLVTSIVQSSSFTTSFTVGLVAQGHISLTTAIPVVMGANVGTSVTNILVSLAHLRRRAEFRRSLGGAIVHDLFNVLSVLLFMPLEWKFHIISKPAGWFARWVGGAAFFTASPKDFNVVKFAVQPVSKVSDFMLGGLLNLSPTARGLLTAVLAVLVLFAALFWLVKILRGLLKDRLAGLFNRTLFASPPVSFLVGIVTTALVQSSSVTTSLVVPLVGAGVLKIKQIYPYTLGANIGTTVTAILAGLAAAAMASGQGDVAQQAAAFALAVAFGHLLFNILGTVVFWPLQWIPISLAKGYAKLASERRVLAAVYILVIFFLLPILIIFLVNSRDFMRLFTG